MVADLRPDWLKTPIEAAVPVHKHCVKTKLIFEVNYLFSFVLNMLFFYSSCLLPKCVRKKVKKKCKRLSNLTRH